MTGHKQKDPLPQEGEHPVVQRLSPTEVQAEMNRNDVLRRIVAIFMNGKRAQRTPHAFPAHDNLVQRMLTAQKDSCEDDFLMALRLYLERIPYFTPQCGRPEQTGYLIEEVTRLMAHPDIGLREVGRRILSIMNAPG